LSVINRWKERNARRSSHYMYVKLPCLVSNCTAPSLDSFANVQNAIACRSILAMYICNTQDSYVGYIKIILVSDAV
jgi:hypothetical protein